MKIHEYQAKALLAEYGIPVPQGGVASTPREAGEVARRLGGEVVVKAQVHAGGRGKAGGIKRVSSAEEAESFAASLLGRNLVTEQTGPQGVPVRRVLVEEAIQGKELYLGILMDATTGGPLILASEAGGMEIEEVAQRFPEKIVKTPIDALLGIQPFQGRRVAYALNLEPELVQRGAELVMKLYRLFEAKDCSLVEINPLVLTSDGSLVALDVKVNLDDDALFRHPELRELRDPEQEDSLEAQAHEHGIAYVKLDGHVGCLVNGAGLAMATMDIVQIAGSRPANFLDVGGGASQEKVAQAFRILISDPQVKRVLVNLFGGILRCDVAAQGIIAAAAERELKIPLIVRMQGTNMMEGKQLLAESSLPVTFADSLSDAVEKLKATWPEA